MRDFLTQNIISIIFGISTLVTTLIALHYKRLEHKHQVENILDEGGQVGLFLSREAMMEYLVNMYDHAKAGDVIWAQCVRCADFSPKVRNKILKAAGKQVKFKMIINKHSPTLAAFRSLFSPIETAKLAEGTDNDISVQGLSDREVVIALPGIESYSAVLVRNPNFVKIMKDWFDTRFDEMM